MADHKSRGDRDHEHNSEEENNTQMTDEEKFYEMLYNRNQFRAIYGAKCSERVEMILDLKTKQLKNAPITLSGSHGTDIQKLKQKLDSCISINNAMNVEEFYEHTNTCIADIKEFMQNIDLKVQRLVRQAEEVKEVTSQLKRQEKDDKIYKILKGSVVV